MLFDLIHRYGPIRCYHAGPKWTKEQKQLRGAPHSQKPQHHWILTIRLFSVISRTLIGDGLTPLQRCSQCILLLQPTGQGLRRRIPCFPQGSKVNKKEPQPTFILDLLCPFPMRLPVLPRGTSRNEEGEMAHRLDCDIVVNEFELQSR